VIVTKDFLTLSGAFGIGKGAVVALVGGGGKTSTLVRLCHECARDGSRVLATTTARMKMEELADVRDVLLWDEMDTTGQTWRSYRGGMRGGGTWIDDVLSGHAVESSSPITFLGRSIMRNKLIGLPSDYLGELLSRLTWDLVVVEADGSRGRSIKGHRLGEPVVPLCATHCVIVIGADGIEAFVNSDHCHRPEVIQDLLGVSWGERLSAKRVVDLLAHRRGLLAKIPGDIEVLVYVNKAPLGREHDAARLFAHELLERCGSRIRRVAVGDNLQGGLVEAFLTETGAT
jgi:probable selenium-dependent hydroxylase accessory protein YqeC